ncbi:YecA family protein [Tepidibacter thalassicus]|uniref:SEC-C motif-containing protein n=1 Tax=Tepidibacter thalassicus DSM 15285 TaxID=1123350 RepID=A0A1M5PNZ4_9FIRM|nr:SEC-C domain-containing protein [Tepidibacter thalassicus]SHH03329.1 SEC-C motif-containing protein [Tepidibacter thalassicus DSM 15285]
MVGRNDLCPCGSGKKYKKCCLNKDKKNLILKQKMDFSQKYDMNITQKLYSYSRKERFYDEYLKAQERFYILKDDEINNKFLSFFNTYYLHDFITSTNKTMAILFYEENKNNLNVIEKNILREKIKSYISVYEIISIEEDKVVLKDLILNSETYVEDVNIFESLNVGELIIGRIAKVVEVNKFIDTILSISPKIKDVIIKDINNMYEKSKSIYKDMITFLIYNTNIFYKYIQQLIEPKVGEYLKSNKKDGNVDKSEKVKENSDNSCSVEELVKGNIEDEYLEVALTVWREYKNSNEKIKGNENGWASALEYYAKKEKGASVTQGEIAKKYKVSPSTLGKRYKEIKSISN